MGKTQRFGLVLSTEDKEALQQLADRERIPAAAVVRRLIWEAVVAAPQSQSVGKIRFVEQGGKQLCD